MKVLLVPRQIQAFPFLASPGLAAHSMVALGQLVLMWLFSPPLKQTAFFSVPSFVELMTSSFSDTTLLWPLV